MKPMEGFKAKASDIATIFEVDEDKIRDLDIQVWLC